MSYTTYRSEDPELQKAWDIIEAVSEQIIEEPEALGTWLETQAKLERYSAFNTMLIAQQYPDATKIADKETWAKRGAVVKQNAKVINIMEPVKQSPKNRNAESDVWKPRYKIKHMYDVSQTSEGFDAESSALVGYKVLAKALERIKTVPYQITDRPVLTMYSQENNAILINPANKRGDRAFFNSLTFAVAANLAADYVPGNDQKPEEGTKPQNDKKAWMKELWQEDDVIRFNCECIAYMMDSKYCPQDDMSYSKQIPHLPKAYLDADKWQVRSMLDNMRKLFTDFTDAVSDVSLGRTRVNGITQPKSKADLIRRIKNRDSVGL